MKDNYPLYKVFIGAVIIVIGAVNLFMHPENIEPSEVTLQQAVNISTGVVNVLFGSIICLLEFIDKGK